MYSCGERPPASRTLKRWLSFASDKNRFARIALDCGGAPSPMPSPALPVVGWTPLGGFAIGTLPFSPISIFLGQFGLWLWSVQLYSLSSSGLHLGIGSI